MQGWCSRSTLDINGDGVYMLKELNINTNIYRMLPYVITLIVLAFTSKSSRAPKAEGIPYARYVRMVLEADLQRAVPDGV